MRGRYGMWNRPTTRTYAYNLTYGDPLTGVKSTDTRYTRASTLEGDSDFSSRSFRASTAPPVNVGFKGYYQRQLEATKAVAANAAAEASSKTSATLSSARTSASATTAKKSVTISEKTTTSTSKDELASSQQSSLEYGRSSGSRALRRAESHAVSSFQDPRHTMVPWNIEDSIYKKVADIHMGPYNKYEADQASEASLARWSRVNKMEADLAALTKSSMAYKSCYAKSASQMAAEALSADASAVSSSSKKTRKTIVESSSKRTAA